MIHGPHQLNWNGTCPALYWNFDNIGDLVTMEGTLTS